MDRILEDGPVQLQHQKTMSPTRRQFIQSATVGAAAVTLARPLSAQSPNEIINVAVIGPGGMGSNHVRTLAANKLVRITAVCDADNARMASTANYVEKTTGKTPKQVRDMRRLLEDNSIEAVFIATPDHWHAPATILACNAGKHVYVEKPASHNIREGRLMIDAARRNKRIVQVGTQSRSTPHIIKAMELLKNGAIGEILVAKAWNSQMRGNIGKTQPSLPPDSLDYDLWLGPAPKVPYRSNLLPGRWRWWYDFGAGDMGNDGVHDIDIACWGLGVATHPVKVAALGGKYFFDDDQQFPDTQNVLFEYAPDAKTSRPRQIIFEMRIWSPYVQEGHENGNAYYGTQGMMLLGKGGGWKLFGPKNELREQMPGTVDLPAHHQNFFDCIRNGKLPNADIEISHRSSTLVHLGNIAVRTGRMLQFDPAKEQIVGDADANKFVRREYREHWAAPKDV